MREEQAEPSMGEQAGVSMADVLLVLPDEVQTMVTWLLREGEAGLSEVAALIEQDEATTGSLLAELVAQGFVQEVPGEDRTTGKSQPLTPMSV